MNFFDKAENIVNNTNNQDVNVNKDEISEFDKENNITLGIDFYEKPLAMLDPTTVYHAHSVKSLIYRIIFICIILSFLVSFIIYCILFNFPPLELFEFFFIWLEMKKNNKNEMYVFLHFLESNNIKNLDKNTFNKDEKK